MGLRVVIDHREGKLKELLDAGQGFGEGIEIAYENLELGDVVIYSGNEVVYVMERKTLADLRASINDGRYRNQKARLMEAHGRHVGYIIEGHIGFSGREQPAIVGAVINTVLRDGLGMFFTSGPTETLSLIKEVVWRVAKDPAKYMPCATGSGAGAELAPAAPIKSESTFTNMLCQVPGISLKTAKAITARWPMFSEMYLELAGLEDEQKLIALKNITTVDGKGKARKISGAVATSLLSALF